LHLHDLTILALPLLLFVRKQAAQDIPLQHLAILPVASIILLSGRMISALEFVVPYVVAGWVIWALTIQAKRKELSS
jgi:hypothetical protein